VRDTRTPRFEEEAKQIPESDRESVLTALEWALRRDPFFGQEVIDTDRRVLVVYQGGYAYLAYYVISGQDITLESLVKRKTPVAPGPLGIEP
jgi:hypothetical protein